jgi:hypothetical protein
MKPGWPFDTRETAKRRSQQRRELRLVDEWIVKRAARDPGSPVPVSESSRGLIEEALRDEADRLRAAIPDETLATMARFERAEAAHRFAVETQTRKGEAQLFGVDFGVRQKNEADASRRSTYPDDELVPILSYVTALVIADEVADDGYRDPRLPAPD